MTNKPKLELTWIGKDEEILAEPRILLYDKEKSYGDQDTENMLIHGDNLLALKALEQEYTGKVKCIYIDPPYNTGSAFEHYDDNLEHSIWLSLIKARLEILRNLLTEDGSIWISIDDDEQAYLKILCDEIFGRNNFVAQNVWQKRYSRENREAIGDVHEYIMVYCININKFKSSRNLIPMTESQAKVYKNPNNDPKGRWRGIPLTAQSGHATAAQFYEIVAPKGNIHTPSAGRCWGISQATFEKHRAEGRIYFGKDNNSQPNLIRYLSEVPGVAPWTWWTCDEVGHNDISKKEILSLFDKNNIFDTPKPELLLQRIIHIATNEGDFILDSFLGSGTTSAVAQKMGRKYIGIELGDHCYTHCKLRLEKVIDGEQGGISKAQNWKGGGGFKFYELAPSLLKKDKFDNWVIDETIYKADFLAAAVAKLNGYSFCPHETIFWKQGESMESSFIFTTTEYVNAEYVDKLSKEMEFGENLLICCSAFDTGLDNRYDNIEIKKIPKSVLNKCEYGKDNYNLTIIDTTEIEEECEDFE